MEIDAFDLLIKKYKDLLECCKNGDDFKVLEIRTQIQNIIEYIMSGGK